MNNRKSILYTIFFCALLMLGTSCEFEFEEDVNENTEVTTQRKSIRNFNEIRIDGILNVYLMQSEFPKAEVVTNDNLQELVSVENVGEILYISSDVEEDYEATVMDVYITIADISKITLNGVTSLNCRDTLMLNELSVNKMNTGNVTIRTVLDKLSVVSDDVGNLDLHGKAINTNIQNEIIGDINAYGFKTEDMYILHGGTGEVRIYVTNSLEVEITGVGNVRCKGSPSSVSKKMTGLGKLFIEN